MELQLVVVGGLLALAGTLVGIVGTLVNGWLTARRESKQWVRQQRLNAYLPAVAFLREFEYRASVHFDIQGRVQGSIPQDVTPEELSEHMSQGSDEAGEYFEYLRRVESELAPLVVLGPEPVRQAAEEFARAAREKPVAWFNFGRDFPPLVKAIREALSIPV